MYCMRVVTKLSKSSNFSGGDYTFCANSVANRQLAVLLLSRMAVNDPFNRPYQQTLLFESTFPAPYFMSFMFIIFLMTYKVLQKQCVLHVIYVKFSKEQGK